MVYEYSGEDRLDRPHHYMYTPFKGPAFLEAFFENRQTYLSRFYTGWSGLGKQHLGEDYLDLGLVCEEGHKLAKFNMDEPVFTHDLLNAILLAQISGDEKVETKKWLDRLVQRFEVNKKIYATYLPGLRKGVGAMDDLRLYWQLGVALYLQYEYACGLKYLSTALKVTDLLCSLPVQQVSEEISDREIVILLQAEVRAVKELIRKKIDGLFA